MGRLRKTRLNSRAKLSTQLLLGFSIYDLIYLGSLSGWWWGRMHCANYAQNSRQA